MLYEQGHYEDALEVNQRALELKPDCSLAHYNKANSLRELGRTRDAIPCFEAALRHQPDFPRADFNLGLAHLLLGNFSEGWSRFETRVAAGEIVLDKYPQPRWDGSPLAGKRLLVHAEQGVGDEILFATCLPDLEVSRAPGLVPDVRPAPSSGCLPAAFLGFTCRLTSASETALRRRSSCLATCEFRRAACRCYCVQRCKAFPDNRGC